VKTSASHATAGCKPGRHAPAESPKTVSLRVVPDKPDRLHIKKSRSSRWRAAVLIAVNLLMAAHIVLWYNGGRPRPTLSPVEPSESMYTIELGQLNAGFVFFAAALLSTFIFGRFFCGWGCHVVALQDLCSHIMNKLGVRPKPFRSRVLLWGPLLLALYMFAWVPFKRMIILPLVKAANWIPPSWLIKLPGPRPPFENHFIVTEFWRTFPAWYVAIPFLLICGFAVVYFLGSKGFCTYACPYGGFFAPMDKISVGRIVVSDACEGCGHCTAVCTSNVRVKEEVNAYGMVVDPGCMKCLDCVSVCPNDALSFSFAPPAVFAKPKTAEAKAGHLHRPEYDLTLGKDLLLFGAAILMFIAFRGMPFIAFRGELGLVPLLMAAGMAAMGAFTLWKLLTLLTTPNVRLQSLQLRLKGRFKPAGILFALGACAYLGVGVWAGAVQASNFIGDIYDERVAVTQSVVFSPGYKPDQADQANALQALKWFERAGPISEGGIGWPYNVDTLNRRAWLYAVAGDLANAEKSLNEAVFLAKQPNVSAIFDLRGIMLLRGKSSAEVDAMYEQVLRHAPGLNQVRMVLANDRLMVGNAAGAVALAEEVIAADPAADAQTLGLAGEVLLKTEQLDRAAAVFKAASQRYPDAPFLRADYASALFFTNQREEAIKEIRRAVELDPKNAFYWRALGEMLQEMGRPEAAEALRKAEELASSQAPQK
jgi:tetratricopeptide (TPR) repeat protein/polyferredoxin